MSSKKIAILIFLISGFSYAAGAPAPKPRPVVAIPPSFKYSLKISPAGYEMKIEIVFSKSVKVEQVKEDLRSGAILAKVNPKVRSLEFLNPQTTGKVTVYRALLTLRTWGLKTELLSDCTEEETPTESWSRLCKLNTRELDGGKYMESKTDETHCKQSRVDSQIFCSIQVFGKSKPFRILGFQILTAENFMVRAKHEALENFARIWFHSQAEGALVEASNAEYAKSRLKADLDRLLEEGMAEVKKTENFSRAGRFIQP